MSDPTSTVSLVVEQLPGIYYNQALEHARNGDLARARDDLHAALALDPKMVDAHVVLGKIQAQLGDFREAVKWFESALELEPGHEAATAGLAKARELLAHGAWGLRLRNLGLAGSVALVFVLGVVSVLTYNSITSRLNHPQPPVSQVREAIQGIDAHYADELQVTAESGGIQVTGNVDIDEQKQLITAVAESQSDGFPVDTSGITVTHPQHLAESFRGLLASLEPQLSREIEVSQDADALVLKGVVCSESVRTRLAETARALVGVREVDVTDLKIRTAAVCVVCEGETLWKLAERFYGDATLWTVIRDANTDCPDPRRIPVGTVLTIPPLGEGNTESEKGTGGGT